MLDLNFIRNNMTLIVEKLKGKKSTFDFSAFEQLDQNRRQLIKDAEAKKSAKKKLSKEIGISKKNQQDAEVLEMQSLEISKEIERLDSQLNALEEDHRKMLLNIPNLYHDSVPEGIDESANVVVRLWGEKPQFDFSPKPHWELGEANGLLDFPRAAKITGARFAVYYANLAKLERMLISMMLDTHTGRHGYTEVLPPFMVNEESMIGTGNLPKFKDDLFKIENYNFYLIPTAEVPLTNLYRAETIAEEELPKKFVAYTPCFRSEAGSYGKDMRGLVRQHQFNKVELLKFVHPDHSYQELELLTKDAETILQMLNLHYRVVLLCSGDLSFSSAKTYDIEVWMPARGSYLEISSCSNFESFQARRAKIKFKGKSGNDFVHTLNGSGLAIGRTVAAIMENYQCADGKIRIPQVLQPNFNNLQFF
jgi:seryl-tRNA synthetase